MPYPALVLSHCKKISVLFYLPPDDAFEEGGNEGGGNGNEEELRNNWNPSREYQVSLLVCLSVRICYPVSRPVSQPACAAGH